MQRLTDILESMGAVSAAQVESAVRHHQRVGRPIGRCLVEIRACTEKTIVEGLSIQLGLPSVDLEAFAPTPDVLAVIHREIAVWHNALPLGIYSRKGAPPALHVAMSRPMDHEALRHLASLTGRSIQPVIAGDTQIEAAIERWYGSDDNLAMAAMDDWIDLE